MALYEIRVYDTDEGESLGGFKAECIPRIGEKVYITGHPKVCRGKHEFFIGIVDDVTHTATYSSGPGSWLVDTVVWLREELAAAVLYCTCDAPSLPTEDGICDGCGKQSREHG